MRKLKSLKLSSQRKPRGNVDDLFGLKRLFSDIYIPDKFLG